MKNSLVTLYLIITYDNVAPQLFKLLDFVHPLPKIMFKDAHLIISLTPFIYWKLSGGIFWLKCAPKKITKVILTVKYSCDNKCKKKKKSSSWVIFVFWGQDLIELHLLLCI